MTAVATLIAVLLLQTAALWPAAAAGKQEPKLAVIGVDKPVKLKWQSGEGDQDGEKTLSTWMRIVVSNTGTQTAAVSPEAFLDAANNGSDTKCTPAHTAQADFGKRESLKTDVKAGGTQPVAIKLTVPKTCANRSGTLILSTGAGDRVEVRFVLPRPAGQKPRYDVAFWLALASAAVLALLMGQASTGFLTHLPIDKPWKIDDSWLTNISTLGAVLGTVLTTTGFVEDWLPGVSLGPLLGLNLLYNAMVLFAPVIYAATCTWTWQPKPKAPAAGSAAVAAGAAEEVRATAVKKGRGGEAAGANARSETPARGGSASARKDAAAETDDGNTEQELKVTGMGWGLWLAAAATLTGVFGQLATVGALVAASSASDGIQDGLYALLSAAALAIGIYGFRFVTGTLARLGGKPSAGPGEKARSASL
jgi:hypothetical protein